MQFDFHKSPQDGGKDKNGKTIIPDETIIEVFEQLLPKDDKKGKLFF